MTSIPDKPTTSRGNTWIIVLSVLLPALVGYLYLGPRLITLDFHRGTLPRINAWINGTTTLVLVTAYIMIRLKNVGAHKRLMLAATGLSATFLVFYMLQHASFPAAEYGGNLKVAYGIVLVTHIVLAAIIAPLVLITLVRGLSGRYSLHRRIARWTFPIWLYVGISGVVVYLMVAPYY